MIALETKLANVHWAPEQQRDVQALLAMPALKAMRAKIDPSAINGGPLLGLNGIVVKSHGGATAGGFGAAGVECLNDREVLEAVQWLARPDLGLVQAL